MHAPIASCGGAHTLISGTVPTDNISLDHLHVGKIDLKMCNLILNSVVFEVEHGLKHTYHPLLLRTGS